AFLFKDKLIFKPPRAKGYDLHQDFIAWPGFPRSFVTAAVAIDPCDLDNGCTVVYPGYHANGCLSPEDGDYHALPPATVDHPPPARPGGRGSRRGRRRWAPGARHFRPASPPPPRRRPPGAAGGGCST